MSTAQVPAIDMNKLNAFIGQFVTDLGASVHTGMVVIGEKLGLYKALADGPMSSAQLAAKTDTDERYLREWLTSTAPPICRAPLSWHWARSRPCRASCNPSAPALAWAGMNMLMMFFTGAKSSSVQATLPIW